MNISLTPELERLVQRKVESGMYSSASEVIRESLRQTSGREMKLADLRAALQPALEAEARGDYSPMDFDSLRASLRAKHSPQVVEM